MAALSNENLSALITRAHGNSLLITLLVQNFATGVYLSGVSGLYSELKSDLNLSNSVLGDYIAISGVGLVFAMLTTPDLFTYWGSATCTLYSVLLSGISLVLYGFSSISNLTMLSISMIFVGYSFVWMMGAVNTQTALLELIEGFPVFGMMQGVHALGVLSGGLVAGGLADIDLKMWQIDALFAGAVVFSMLAPFPYLINQEIEMQIDNHREEIKRFVEVERRKLLLQRQRLSQLEDNAVVLALLASVQQSQSSRSSSASTSRSHSFREERPLLIKSETDLHSTNDKVTQDDNDDSQRPFLSPPAEDGNYGTVSQRKSVKRSTSSDKYGNQRSLKKNKSFDASHSDYPNDPLLLAVGGEGVDHRGGDEDAEVPHDLTDYRDVKSYVLLNIIMCFAGLGSGVALSWAELYISAYWSTSDVVATFGYVGFQLGAAASRFLTDYVIESVGRQYLLVLGCFGASLGMLMTSLACLTATTGSLAVAIVGFVIAGFCFGPIYPAALSYATGLHGYSAGEALSVLNAATLVAGMVLSPLIFGNLIDWIGYMVAFLIQVGVYALGGVLAMQVVSEIVPLTSVIASRSSSRSSSMAIPTSTV